MGLADTRATNERCATKRHALAHPIGFMVHATQSMLHCPATHGLQPRGTPGLALRESQQPLHSTPLHSTPLRVPLCLSSGPF